MEAIKRVIPSEGKEWSEGIDEASLGSGGHAYDKRREGGMVILQEGVEVSCA